AGRTGGSGACWTFAFSLIAHPPAGLVAGVLFSWPGFPKKFFFGLCPGFAAPPKRKMLRGGVCLGWGGQRLARSGTRTGGEGAGDEGGDLGQRHHRGAGGRAP